MEFLKLGAKRRKALVISLLFSEFLLKWNLKVKTTYQCNDIKILSTKLYARIKEKLNGVPQARPKKKKTEER